MFVIDFYSIRVYQVKIRVDIHSFLLSLILLESCSSPQSRKLFCQKSCSRTQLNLLFFLRKSVFANYRDFFLLTGSGKEVSNTVICNTHKKKNSTLINTYILEKKLKTKINSCLVGFLSFFFSRGVFSREGV